MGILLLLLKCIGILLLVLLALVLLTILIVLCSPIRYTLAAEKNASYSVQAEVRWLFSRLCFCGASGQEWQTEIFLFGKTLDEWKKKKEKKQNKKKKQETIVTVREKAVQNTEKREAQKQTSERPIAQKRTEPQARQQKKIEANPPQQTQLTEAANTVKEVEQANQPEQSKQLKQPKHPQQPKQGIRRVKLSEIEEEAPQQTGTLEEEEAFFTGETEEMSETEGFSWKKTLLQAEDKKGILKAVARLLRRLTKGILPYQMVFRGTLGTGDPVLTGYMLAVFGILKGKFGKNLVVRGDFSRMCAEDLYISVKGKIVLGYLCYAVAAFVLTKPVRRLIQILWKGRKQNGESI